MNDKNVISDSSPEYDAVDVLITCIASEIDENKFDLSPVFKKLSSDEEMIKKGELAYDKILMSAITISAAFKGGLYFPEFRKESKLLESEKSEIKEKFKLALKEFYWFKSFGLRIPIYFIPLILFMAEWLIFKSGLIAEVGLGLLTIGESSFPKLETLTMFFINPTLLSFLAYYHIKMIIKSITNE